MSTQTGIFQIQSCGDETQTPFLNFLGTDGNIIGSIYRSSQQTIGLDGLNIVSQLAFNGTSTAFLTIDPLNEFIPPTCQHISFTVKSNDVSTTGLRQLASINFPAGSDANLNIMSLFRSGTDMVTSCACSRSFFAHNQSDGGSVIMFNDSSAGSVLNGSPVVSVSGNTLNINWACGGSLIGQVVCHIELTYSAF